MGEEGKKWAKNRIKELETKYPQGVLVIHEGTVARERSHVGRGVLKIGLLWLGH